ncbi:NYN domain-containing protein [Sphaerisporangium album]|uniref:NYN domain-containing protein n=1 Tax=Sphaerisporangium album TaxID=509200 RepID=A0A367FSS4_9ACTN|nr:NYN domain-containing protein [Sphaerisporangium album]RCG32727.1 NYN domain-containing protein [Sphaerisporangium album]
MITPVTDLDEFRTRASRTSRRARRLEHQESLRHGRAMHLLDIENLVGAPHPTTCEVEEVMTVYEMVVPIGEMDQYMVAVNPSALVAVGIAFPGVRLLTRPGPDGADQALGETAHDDRIDLRFERVVIGSGDGYFVDLARWLAEAGLHVTVVSRPGSLSRRLSAAVSDVVSLEVPTQHAA